MGVTFSIATDTHDCQSEYECDYCWSRSLHVHNANADELLSALTIGTVDPCGTIRGGELAAACQRLLADPSFDTEARIPGGDPSDPSALGARMILIPRPAGRLRQHVRKLLHIAELAGELGRVAWG